MTSPNLNFPFGFAWTLPNTPFNPLVMLAAEENIFAFKIEQKEGECATLEIDLKNPRLGLNNPGRYQWAWFSYQDKGGHVWPLFYGRLISYPTDFLFNAVTLRFVAMPGDMLAQKQALAATLMTLPSYDPVFIDAASRLDPDQALEGYAALWHTDRTSLTVTTSSVADGEDGVIVFQEADAFYDSVKTTIDQPPLKSVYCEATVNWDQQDSNIVDMGMRSINSFSGDGIISNWPKPFASIGAGWSCHYSSANDQGHTALAQNITTTFSWRNQEKTHAFGDTMSINQNWSRPGPSWAASAYRAVVSTFNKIAIIDQDPDGFNDPTAETRYTDVWVIPWTINTRLVLRYEAKRPRTERIRFTLSANVQPVFSDPGGQQANFAQDSEFLQLKGSVGIEGPYGNFRENWAASTQYFLYDYFMVGTTAYAVTRDHLSATVFDPQQTATIWQPQTLYPAGLNVQVGFQVYAVLISHQSGNSFNAALLDGDGNIVYQPEIDPHNGAPLYQFLPNFRGHWATATVYVSNDIFLGPDGSTYQVQIGHTSTTFARFNTDPTGRLLYALLLNPAPIGDVALASYFPSDRGIDSIAYCISRARARLMLRSRAVKTSFDCLFDMAIHATLRHSAELFDPRFPSGSVTGKIISYRLTAAENQGPVGNIEIGSCVGSGISLHAFAGDPGYVDVSYVDTGYQYYTGQFIPNGDGDVFFSPPMWAPIDDGLVFPLSKSDAVIAESVLHGNTAQEDQAVLAQATFSQLITYQQYAAAGDPTSIAQQVEQAHQAQINAWAQALAKTPTWYRLVLKPVVNGPFSTEYDLTVTQFQPPIQIDLGLLPSPLAP